MDREKLVNPQEWVQLHKDNVETHRHFTCSYYETCLTYAAQRHWQGFTCKDCFVRILDERRKDHDRNKIRD